MEPNKLTVIQNADKGFHERWHEGRNLCNFPHPFRALLIGRPGCGKTCAAQNILIRQDPPFERLIIAHVDGEYSKEWDECDPTTIVDDVPNFKDIDGKLKTLIVFADFDVDNLKREQKHLLSRLFGYCSTHKNCSIILCQQDPSAIPPLIRRLSNLFVLWRGLDMRILDQYGTKMGLEAGAVRHYFGKYIKTVHDSVWLDTTPGTPAPVRVNCYEVVNEGN
jgi:hypothetical protein